MTKDEQEAIKAYLAVFVKGLKPTISKEAKLSTELTFLTSAVLTARCLEVEAPDSWQICILSGRSILEPLKPQT